MLPVPFFLLPVHPGGAEPDLCWAYLGFLVPFEWRPRGFFLPRSFLYPAAQKSCDPRAAPANEAWK